MSEPFVFDPRSPYCKQPYGAVPVKTGVTLHVRPLEAAGFTGCTLVQQLEFAGKVQELPLVREGIDGPRRRFSLSFPAPETPDLVWYHFRLRRRLPRRRPP